MIVFTRKYPIQRMLKKRSFRSSRLPALRYGTVGIYCLSTFRFEYRYCLFLRKFFKRLFKRRKRKVRTMCRKKTWLFIRPNYTLTHKSKNARMGKGKGPFKRWCTIVYPGRIFIEHANITPKVYSRYLWKMRIKMKLDLKMIHKAFSTLKRQAVNTGVFSGSGSLELVRVRRSLFFTQKIFHQLTEKQALKI